MTQQPEVSPRADVLREAETLICGDRNRTYGSPTQNFTNIADMWNVQLRHLFKDDAKLEPRHVAELLILLKVARNIAADKRDNWVDIAGYAACGYETTVDAPEDNVPDAPKGATYTIAASSNESPAEIARRIQRQIGLTSGV